MPLPLIPMIQIFYSRDCSQKGLAALFYILILKWPHYRSLLPHEPLATKIFLTCKVWVELNPLTAHTVLSPQWVCMKLDKRRDGKDLEAMSAQVMTVSIFLFFFFSLNLLTHFSYDDHHSTRAWWYILFDRGHSCDTIDQIKSQQWVAVGPVMAMAAYRRKDKT